MCCGNRFGLCQSCDVFIGMYFELSVVGRDHFTDQFARRGSASEHSTLALGRRCAADDEGFCGSQDALLLFDLLLRTHAGVGWSRNE